MWMQLEKLLGFLKMQRFTLDLYICSSFSCPILLIIESKTCDYAVLYRTIFGDSVLCFYDFIVTLNTILKQIAKVILAVGQYVSRVVSQFSVFLKKRLNIFWKFYMKLES